MTSKQRSKLKSIAANLSPVTQIGKGGIFGQPLKDALRGARGARDHQSERPPPRQRRTRIRWRRMPPTSSEPRWCTSSAERRCSTAARSARTSSTSSSDRSSDSSIEPRFPQGRRRNRLRGPEESPEKAVQKCRSEQTEFRKADPDEGAAFPVGTRPAKYRRTRFFCASSRIPRPKERCLAPRGEGKACGHFSTKGKRAIPRGQRENFFPKSLTNGEGRGIMPVQEDNR